MHFALLLQPPFLYWLIGYSGAAAGILFVEHLAVNSWLPSGSTTGKNSLASDQPLRPAEFAYLLKNGDISHAISVLAVDLTQRALKGAAQARVADGEVVAQSAPDQTTKNLEDIKETKDFAGEGVETIDVEESVDSQLSDAPAYEAGMWTVVKKQMLDWSTEQKESLMLASLRKNPIAYTRRLTRIYNFFTQTLRSFVVQVTKDPRHLRRYFSMAGILRLLSDFSIAGHQQIFEDQLKADLLRRGLMVSGEHKSSIARLCFALSPILCVTTLVVFFQMASISIASEVMAAVLVISIVAARLLYGLKEFLPYLDDIVQVLRFLHRRSWRLAVLRLLSRYIRVVLALFCALVYVVPMVVAFLLLRLASVPPSRPLLLLCFLTSFVFLCALNLGLRGVQILQEEYATTYGLSKIRLLRSQISSLSPLEVFVQMLQSKTYDQRFSDLMAIYGIETLLFLA